MRPNRVLAGAGLWLLAVVTVAGLAWFAIDSAGDSVSGAQNVTVIPANADGTSLGSGRTGIGLAVGPDGSAPSSAAGTTTSPAVTPRSAAQWVSRTYSGSAGRVTVSCTGSAAAMESASPSGGWSMAVEKEGPEEVEVVFGHGSDGSVTVQAHCAGGAPVFSATTGTETEDDGHGGSGSNGSGGSGAGSSGSGGDG